MMKELQKIDNHTDNLYFYYSLDYNEPLLEYVEILAEEYRPVIKEDWECGYYVSKAIGNFAIRFFDNKLDKRALKKYLDDEGILNTIEAFGYDIQKFWYLLLFILDFSTGMCISGTKLNNSPRENISKLVEGILQNIESADFDKIEIAKVKNPMKLVLEIEGKRKTIIEDHDSLLFIAEILSNELNKSEGNGRLDFSHTTLKTKMVNGNAEFENDALSNSVHIWYFAKMLLSFFELMPPQKVNAPKGSLVSYNKMLLVSRLIYILGLSKNKNFKDTEDTLKGYLKQYKNLKLNYFNGRYT